jgi:hypothetical protein
MRTVYGAQLDIKPRQGTTVHLEIADLQQVLLDWLSRWYSRKGVALDLAFDGRGHSPLPEHAVLARSQQAGPFTLVTLRWVYPHDPDPTVLWQSECVIAADGEGIEFTIIIRIASARFVVKPVSFSLHRPRVIAEVISNFQVCTGNTQLEQDPIAIASVDVPEFVQRTLTDPTRALPVVLVSPDLWSDRPVVDARHLQNRLLGTALVATLTDKWAAFALTDAVGKELSCFNGAVRLYWPGFSSQDHTRRHPLYFADSIRAHQKEGRLLEDHLFRFLSSIASFRLRDGPLTRSARAEIAVENRRLLDELKAKAESGTATPEEDQELLEMALEDNERLTEENEELTERNQDLQAKLDEMETELDAHRANLEDLWTYQGDQSPLGSADERVPSESDAEPTSVADALKRVAAQYKDVLSIWESASQSAAASGFARPEQALRALIAVGDLGREYFASREKGRSMGRWEDFFEQRGFKYAPTEAQNTQTMYGTYRNFRHEDQMRRMLKHLTLGGGDKINCLQIYFDADDEQKRILIGYCGEHLPYYGQRT